MKLRFFVAVGVVLLSPQVACSGTGAEPIDGGVVDASSPDGDAARAPEPGVPRVDATIPGHALATVDLYGSVIVVDDKGAVWDIAGSRVQRYGSAPGFDPSARDLRMENRRLVYASGNEIRALADGAVVLTSPEGPIRSFAVAEGGAFVVATASGKVLRVAPGSSTTLAEGTVGGVGGSYSLTYFAKVSGDTTDFFAVDKLDAGVASFSALDAVPVRFFGDPPIAATTRGAFVFTSFRSRMDVPEATPLFDMATTEGGLIFAAPSAADPSQTVVRLTNAKTRTVSTVRVTKSRVVAVGFTSTQGPYWFENEADGSSTLYGLGTGNIARP